MPPAGFWTDMLDPSWPELESAAPAELLRPARVELEAPARPETEPRPTLESHGGYLVGVLLVPVALPEEDRLVFQEVDLVVTGEAVLTVRKSSGDDPPLDADVIAEIVGASRESPGRFVRLLVDEVAERYLQAIDALEDEIDELEGGIGAWPSDRIQRRAVGVRRAIIRLRRVVAPTRDAVRRVVDGRIEVAGAPELFPHEVLLGFGDSYDKLLRATEGLDAARDLLASVRDYQQAKIAETQNDVVRMLTVVASLALVPSFIVGFYGQNFQSQFDSAFWHLGVSVGLIAGSVVLLLGLFRWRRWI